MSLIKSISIVASSKKQFLSKNSWYQLIEQAYPITEEQFKKLWKLHPLQHDEIMMFSRLVAIPRYQKLYGYNVEYRYSGKNMVSADVENEIMTTSLNWVNRLEAKSNYNGLLVNWYRDGKDYMGAHSDDERDLRKGAAIYSFSFGEERLFRIINKRSHEKIDIVLPHGSLLIMGGSMQHEFKHALPARKKYKSPRVNFTIRSFTTQKL